MDSRKQVPGTQGWGRDPEDEKSRNSGKQQADVGRDLWSGDKHQATTNRIGVPGHMAHRRAHTHTGT